MHLDKTPLPPWCLLPRWLRWQRICLQCRRPRFSPWVGKIPWRREWQHTPVFLPGEFHGQMILLDYSPWGLKESDMTEWRAVLLHSPLGFSCGSVVKIICPQCRRCRRHWFSPWVWKITWRRAWQPTPVFLPWRIPRKEEPGGFQSIGSHRIGMTESAEHACTHTVP